MEQVQGFLLEISILQPLFYWQQTVKTFHVFSVMRVHYTQLIKKTCEDTGSTIEKMNYYRYIQVKPGQKVSVTRQKDIEYIVPL